MWIKMKIFCIKKTLSIFRPQSVNLIGIFFQAGWLVGRSVGWLNRFMDAVPVNSAPAPLRGSPTRDNPKIACHITMTSQWAWWPLKSPASRLFTQLFIQGIDQRKHQSSASLAFVRGIRWWPVNSPHKGPVTRKMFPFNDVIMKGAALNAWSSLVKRLHCLQNKQDRIWDYCLW